MKDVKDFYISEIYKEGMPLPDDLTTKQVSELGKTWYFAMWMLNFRSEECVRTIRKSIVKLTT